MDDIARFGAYLSDEKHSSRNTVSSYLRDTTQFAEYLHNYCDIDLREADSAAVQDYMDWMLSHGEVRRLRHPVSGVIKKKKRKDQRRSELIALDIGDLNLPAGFIRCSNSKKGADHPLYHGAVKALQDYIKGVRPQLIADTEETALFVNMNGERMSRQGFWKIIKHYQEKAGIQKDITPTLCAIPLRCICWKTAQTSGPFRRCWVTRIFPPPRSTPTSSRISSRTSTRRRTQERKRKRNNRQGRSPAGFF